MVSHEPVKLALAGVAEGRVADVMREADGLEQVEIDDDMRVTVPQPEGDRLRDTRDLEGMRQPRAIKVVLAGLKNLRLGLEPAEGRAEHDAVAVLVKNGAVVVGALRIVRIVQELAVERAVEIARHFAKLAASARRCERVHASVTTACPGDPA